MPSLFEDTESALIYATNEIGIDKELDVKKKIMKTSLYSIYLLSSSETSYSSCQALLVEHPPAKELSAHILPVKIVATATKSEINQKILQAVQDHFKQAE